MKEKNRSLFESLSPEGGGINRCFSLFSHRVCHAGYLCERF